MTIHKGKMKNDEEGTNRFARHVYANPKDPVVCPILEMSIVVLTKVYQRSDTSRYVFGLSAKDRFNKWLMKIYTENKDDILSLGVTIA